ncbi:MAG: serine protease [Elainellaceae cyanobacterium]
MQNPLGFTVQILHRTNPQLVGTGFVFRPEGKILTCAHVVRDASEEGEVAPGVEVQVRFRRDNIDPVYKQDHVARVVESFHREHENHYYDDVAVIELVDAPESLIRRDKIAQLEPAYNPENEDSSGNRFRSYGYSPAAPQFASSYADGEIVGPIEVPQGVEVRADPLALRSENIGRGMSGAALLDTKRNRVVGLITHRHRSREAANGRMAFGVDAKIVLL